MLNDTLCIIHIICRLGYIPEKNVVTCTKIILKDVIPPLGIKSHKIISNTHRHVCVRPPRVMYKSENLGKKITPNVPLQETG